MKAQEIMTGNPHSCQPSDKVCTAINIMREYDCGIIPVTDGSGGKHLVGVVTDRDIALKMCEEEKTCKDFNVQSCMSEKVYFCYPEDDIHKVEQLMKEHQVQRIPVAEHDGTLKGIISLSDLAREANKEKEEGRHDLSEKDVAELVEAIKMP